MLYVPHWKSSRKVYSHILLLLNMMHLLRRRKILRPGSLDSSKACIANVKDLGERLANLT